MNIEFDTKTALTAPTHAHSANRQPRLARKARVPITRAAPVRIPITRWRGHSFRPMLTHDWAEHSAAAIILGETMDAPSDTDTFLVTDPAGAFVVREQLKFWA